MSEFYFSPWLAPEVKIFIHLMIQLNYRYNSKGFDAIIKLKLKHFNYLETSTAVACINKHWVIYFNAYKECSITLVRKLD